MAERVTHINASWRDVVSEVLGDPDVLFTPESYPGTQDQTVIYYFPEGVEEREDFFDNNVTLIIRRYSIGSEFPLRVYFFKVEDGNRVQYSESQSVTKLQIDETGQILRFLSPEDQDAKGFEINISGEVRQLV